MGTIRLLVATLSVTALLAAGTGCEDEPAPVPPGPVELSWQEISLPAPPAGERIVLRAAAVCSGKWYLAGAYGGAGDSTRPAAWTSDNGRDWSAMTVAADSYYGVRSVIFTAACRDGRLAAIGGRPGGAHGNPRISSYHLVSAPGGDEVLTEVAGRNELYGGPTATNVGRLSAGPRGWMITGNRSSGAAVWNSPDAATFEIAEGTPVLSTNAERVTWASDAAGYDDGWLVVGGTIARGRIDRDAAAWTSPDGRTWQSMPTPPDPEYDEMSLVARQGDALVAVGLSGATFQTWRLSGGAWQVAGRFGSTQAAPTTTAGRSGTATAASLATTPGSVIAAVSDGSSYQVWLSSDGGASWRPVGAPMAMPAGTGTGAAVAGVPGSAGEPDRVVLAADGGASGRVFLAMLPG